VSAVLRRERLRPRHSGLPSERRGVASADALAQPAPVVVHRGGPGNPKMHRCVCYESVPRPGVVPTVAPMAAPWLIRHAHVTGVGGVSQRVFVSFPKEAKASVHRALHFACHAPQPTSRVSTNVCLLNAPIVTSQAQQQATSHNGHARERHSLSREMQRHLRRPAHAVPRTHEHAPSRSGLSPRRSEDVVSLSWKQTQWHGIRG